LRPRRNEPAVSAGACPFHRQQNRAAPFAADADPLDEAQHDHQDRPPQADLLVGRYGADKKGREARQQQGGNQCGLAADAIAVMPEDRGTDRPGDKAHCEHGECLQCTGQRVGGRKIQFRKDQCGHLTVQQKIVPFDRRADRAGNHRAAQLSASIDLGQRDGGDAGYSHRAMLPFRATGARPDPFLVAGSP
jgi:hypothetical protein